MGDVLEGDFFSAFASSHFHAMEIYCSKINQKKSLIDRYFPSTFYQTCFKPQKERW